MQLLPIKCSQYLRSHVSMCEHKEKQNVHKLISPLCDHHQSRKKYLCCHITRRMLKFHRIRNKPQIKFIRCSFKLHFVKSLVEVICCSTRVTFYNGIVVAEGTKEWERDRMINVLSDQRQKATQKEKIVHA